MPKQNPELVAEAQKYGIDTNTVEGEPMTDQGLKGAITKYKNENNISDDDQNPEKGDENPTEMIEKSKYNELEKELEELKKANSEKTATFEKEDEDGNFPAEYKKLLEENRDLRAKVKSLKAEKNQIGKTVTEKEYKEMKTELKAAKKQHREAVAKVADLESKASESDKK